MEIDKELILKLEHLSRLQLTDSERKDMIGDLNKILGMVEKLNEIDTDGVEPLTHICEAVNVFRADEVKNQLSRTDAFQNAPKTDGKFFMVPKVIKK